MRDEAEEQVAVGLDIVEPRLRRALVEALARHPFLVAAPDGVPPRVVISDRPGPHEEAPTLTVGEPSPAATGGSVLSTDDPGLIVSAAHLLAAGYRLARGTPGEGEAAGHVHLTPREHQVLELLVGGASNKHIANALDISVHTAKFHVTAVLEKLGARNRSDAVGIALRDGHVTL